MKQLSRWLLEDGLLAEPELQRAEQLQQDRGIPLVTAYIELDLIGEREIVDLLARHHGLPKAPRKLYKLTVPPKALSFIPQDHCWQNGLFPFGIDLPSRTLQVAILDPGDDEALRLLQRLPGNLEADLYLAGPRQLEKAIRKHFLDSIVEDTNTPGLRFFGYENITNPGVSSSTQEDSFDDILLAGPGTTPLAASPPPEPALDPATEIRLPPPRRPTTSEQAAVRTRPPTAEQVHRPRSPSAESAPAREAEEPPWRAERSTPEMIARQKTETIPPREAASPSSGEASASAEEVVALQQRVDVLELALLEVLELVARTSLELSDRAERIAGKLGRGLK